MKSIVLSLTIVVFSLQLSFAQTSTGQGYIIAQNQDTLRGYLMDDLDINLSKSVKFSLNVSGADSKEYGPTDILGFTFNSGKSFESIDAKFSDEKVFAKKLADGKIKVLYEQGIEPQKFNMHLYRQDTNFSVVLEYPEKTIVEKGAKKFSQTSKKYLGILSVITEGFNIPDLKFKQKPLMSYLNDYNRKHSTTFRTFEYVRKVETSYDASIGAHFFGGSDDKQFRAAFFRDKLFPERSKKVYFRAGLTYRYADIVTSGDHILNVLPFGFRYQPNQGKVSPYAHASLGLAFTVSETRYSSVTGSEYSFGVVPGINLGAGIRYKIKSNYLFTEITPSFNNGFLLNIGFTF